MPLIKDISKCRRISKDKQSLDSDESIDDANTELEDEYIKMRKLFRESRDQKFIKRLKKKLKENLLKHINEDPSSKNEIPKVEYPEPQPKIEKNKKTGKTELDSNKKSGLGNDLGAKKKVSKISKKSESLRNNTTDKSKNNIDPLANHKFTQQTISDTKSDKPAKDDNKTSSANKKKDKAKKEVQDDYPLSMSDRELTKNEVEAMIRMVLRQSREEGGDAAGIDDVSFGETESTPSENSLDIGVDPGLSTTPDDVSPGPASDGEENNFVY